MIIEEIREKIKRYSEKREDSENSTKLQKVFLVLFMVLVAFLSFGFGVLSESKTNEKAEVVVEKPENTVFAESAQSKKGNNSEKNQKNQGKKEKKFVASQNGTRFYLPWCGGVSRINEENKVWFATKNEARDYGLTPAKNCDGI